MRKMPESTKNLSKTISATVGGEVIHHLNDIVHPNRDYIKDSDFDPEEYHKAMEASLQEIDDGKIAITIDFEKELKEKEEFKQRMKMKERERMKKKKV